MINVVNGSKTNHAARIWYNMDSESSVPLAFESSQAPVTACEEQNRLVLCTTTASDITTHTQGATQICSTYHAKPTIVISISDISTYLRHSILIINEKCRSSRMMYSQLRWKSVRHDVNIPSSSPRRMICSSLKICEHGIASEVLEKRMVCEQCDTNHPTLSVNTTPLVHLHSVV